MEPVQRSPLPRRAGARLPLSNFTELDIWRYIARDNVELASIYYAHQRPVYQRDGMWMTPGVWGGPADGEELQTLSVRYRTVGDGSTTGAVLSDALTTRPSWPRLRLHV